MKNILLINPNYRLEIRWVASEKDMEVKADYMPLGLATVAALTPKGYHVDIWDELVRGPIENARLEATYDLVGVTSHSANLGRALKIGDYFRKQGLMVVVGGPGATSNPDRCRGRFDVIFIGEAEFTWPRFLADWENRAFKQEYRQIEKPDVVHTPLPRWDSIVDDVPKYAMGTVQTTRGCPNDCEFCDVVYLNGKRQRHKPVERILEEIRALQRLGVRSISFNDDNFTINHKWAKGVLLEIIPLNNSFSEPLRFMTQLSIDVARDDELLELLADANFYQVLIGIESPNKESLKEIGKLGNLKGDMITEVKKVLSYGIVVRGAMIVGFDHDDQTIFDMQYDFIQAACFPSVSMHMLNAPVGTRIWRRLRAEGRVIDAFAIADSSTQRLFNNIIPKQMTRVELMQGFRDLYARLFTWESFAERMHCFIALASRPPRVPQKPEDMEQLLQLGPGLGLDVATCRTMDAIFLFTHQHAPFLLGRVKELVLQFVRYRESVYDFLPGLDQQIAIESAPGFSLKLDSRPIAVPEAFRRDFMKFFPELHRRVYLNLKDRSRGAEALLEIFVEFLVHEEGLPEMTDHHLVMLSEVADRTCARFNGQKLADFVPREAADEAVPDAGRLQLHDDILKSLEQELSRFARGRREGLAA